MRMFAKLMFVILIMTWIRAIFEGTEHNPDMCFTLFFVGLLGILPVAITAYAWSDTKHGGREGLILVLILNAERIFGVLFFLVVTILGVLFGVIKL